MDPILNRYLNRNIKVVLNFAKGAIIYRGTLTEVTDKFIILDEIQKGTTMIAIEDITTVYEVRDGER